MGGYTVLDFKGVALSTGIADPVPGVFGVLKETKKVTVVHNLKVGAVSYPDMMATFIGSATTGYTAKIAVPAGTLTIVVGTDDNVTPTIA